MKKIIISLMIMVGILYSCTGRERDPEEYITAENFVVYTSAAASNTTPAVITTAQSTETSAAYKRLSYALNGSVIELQLGGEDVYELDLNYEPDKNFISVGDFDGDNIDEIYVPSAYAPEYGVYYSYDPEKGQLCDEDKLNEFGRFVKLTADGSLIEETQSDTATNTTEYQWLGGELKPIRRTQTYSSQDGTLHTDIYQYDENGTEFLAESK